MNTYEEIRNGLITPYELLHERCDQREENNVCKLYRKKKAESWWNGNIKCENSCPLVREVEKDMQKFKESRDYSALALAERPKAYCKDCRKENEGQYYVALSTVAIRHNAWKFMAIMPMLDPEKYKTKGKFALLSLEEQQEIVKYASEEELVALHFIAEIEGTKIDLPYKYPHIKTAAAVFLANLYLFLKNRAINPPMLTAKVAGSILQKQFHMIKY